jgi:hypothetical protein
MRKVNRGQKAGSFSLPAPVGGLNTRDALAMMEPVYAPNGWDFFPNGTHVEVRKGFASQTTQALSAGGSAVPGFVKYGETSLWAACYKQSTSELILKDIIGGTTQTISGHAVVYAPSYTQFTNSAGQFVAAVFRNNDATNNYYTFDGTTWTARTAATTNSQSFKFVASFRNRLWFLTDASGKGLSAYYLPTSAITGTTVEFPLGGVASKGGSLYAIGTWTRDGGEGGADDLIVFTTTAGQAIVYQGTDPSSPATFGLVGVYDLSRPIGKPFKYGSDLLMPTEDGLYSMNQILGGNIGPEFAVSHIIRSLWQRYAAAAILVGAATIPERVSICYSAKLNHLMVFLRNTNTSGTAQNYVLVMNTINRAWTQYTNVLLSFGYNVDTLAGDIYFGQVLGTTGTVYKFGTATTDPSGGIVAIIQQAYTYLGIPGTSKQITSVKPSVTIDGNASIVSMFGIPDYKEGPGSTPYSPYGATSDGVTLTSGSYAPMLSLPVVGTAISIGCVLNQPNSGASNLMKWSSTNVLFIPGGFV